MKTIIIQTLGCALFTALMSARLPAAEAPLNTKESSFKFTGHTFTHDFDGEAKVFSGNAQIDPQKPQIVVAATIDIKTANLTTNNSSRDGNMFKWMNITVNPAITFQLTNVKATKGDPAAATKEKPAEFAVTGNFTLNKVTKPLETTARGWREGKWLVVAGKTKVDTTAHGLPILGAAVTAVDKNVDVDFRLVFDLPAELQLGAAKVAAEKPTVTPASPTSATATKN